MKLTADEELRNIVKTDTAMNGIASYREQTHEGIIIEQNTGSAKQYVRETMKSTLEENILKNAGIRQNGSGAAVSETEIAAAKKTAVAGIANGGTARIAAGYAFSNIEKGITDTDSQSNMSDKAASLTARATTATTRTAVTAGREIKGTVRLVRGAKAGTITDKAARIGLLKNGTGMIKNVGAAPIKAFEATTDNKDSERFEMQSLFRAKNTIIQTERTLKVTSRAAANAASKTAAGIRKTPQRIKNTARTASQAANTAKRAAANVIQGVKNTASALANPAVLKVVGIIAAAGVAILLIISVASSIASIIPNITLSSDDIDLSETYKYITELDTDLNYELANIPKEHAADVIHYYINGYEVDSNGTSVYSNADHYLNYLNVKYDDYTFEEVTDELTELYSSLNNIKYNEGQDTVQVTTTINGKTTTTTALVTVLDVMLTTKSIDEYLDDNKDTALDADQMERYQSLCEMGGMALRQELGNPFKGKSWWPSRHYGWKLEYGSKVLSEGVTINKPAGTVVTAVMSGKVTEAGYSKDKGYYIIQQTDSSTVYYEQCQSIKVSKGDEIKTGDEIAAIGSNGLYMEYIKNGHSLNPEFYLYNESTGKGGSRIIEVARSQLGTTPGSKYWTTFGYPSNSNPPWCAMFASWCADQCGYTQDGTVLRFAYCPFGVKWFVDNGLWHDKNSGYIPQSGDYIFFDWQQDGVIDHVGLVDYVEKGTVYTIEGNRSVPGQQNSVVIKWYSLTTFAVEGYGSPVY